MINKKSILNILTQISHYGKIQTSDLGKKHQDERIEFFLVDNDKYMNMTMAGLEQEEQIYDDALA